MYVDGCFCNSVATSMVGGAGLAVSFSLIRFLYKFVYSISVFNFYGNLLFVFSSVCRFIRTEAI